uniref:NADH-ubiquinone oxidoreductase chain 2 n=1 Tax=Colasposoma dauricum TaxID=1301243 RepID=A0A8A5L724_9CUCU|nr:NADH dehydrogenase subunit 2 [Colasposoma dauricum]
MFFLTMISGTIITLSSYSWMSMWMGLEINLLSIIPLLKQNNNKFPSEAAFKYFIVQSLASTMFLFSMILNMNLIEFILMNKISLIILYSSILTKLGSAPFHAWFPEVVEGLNWMNCILMLTWQKVAPMIILIQNLKLNYFIITIIVLSSMLGSIIGMNQTSMRKILAYSSINHIAWMISSMLSNKMIWMIYFIIYSIISITIIISLKMYKIYFIYQLSMLKDNNTLNLLFNLNFLSLGGLPPFLGFFPKWLTINYLILMNSYFLTITLIMFTLIMLFIYTRILFSSMTINSNTNYLKIENFSKNKLVLINFFSLISLIFCPLMFNFV